MSDFELPQRARELLSDLSLVEGSANTIRDQIADLTSQAREEAERVSRDKEVLDSLVESRTHAYELVAEVWAEYELAKSRLEAKQLEEKLHPAPVAAEKVRAKGKEVAETRRRAKLAEYIVELYEWNFPWLTELRDEGADEAYLSEGTEEEQPTHDPVKHWLTAEEFKALPSDERNQRALDRYLKGRKSPWQLGRDYERYIGYLREQQGCKVTYHGIFKGFEDLGRDVLAEKDGAMEVIQCKRWAQHKTIHEKHIFQLYGTMVLAKLENPGKEITGTFTTTTTLSEKAREVAEFLAIKIEEGIPLDDYPRIKCNIARRGEEKIYHLPFDQQYDTTVVEPERGERYVSTTAEAEELGFRRAWRWRGETAA